MAVMNLRRLLVLVMLGLSGSCTTTREDLPLTEAQSAVLDELQDLRAAGAYEEALATIDALLAEEPQATMVRRLEALRSATRQEILQARYVQVRIELDSTRVALGTPITGQVVIRNRSSSRLFIPATNGVTPTTVELRLRYEEFDVGGTVLSEERRRPISLGKDVELGPQESFGAPIVLDSLEFGPHRTNYRTYTLDGTFYPVETVVGEEAFPGNLRIEPATCQVFPRNYEHLAARPLERLEEAVAKNSAVHVPLAAALVAGDQRERAVEALVGTLARPSEDRPDGPTRTACCVGLRILTGEELPARPKEWIDWWRRQ